MKVWAYFKDITLADGAGFVTILMFIVSIVSIAISTWRYIDIRRKEQKQKNFENYHNILKSISLGRYEKDATMKLVSQLAYIFELRNFKSYKEITQRCLVKLYKEWSESVSEKEKKKYLQNEIIYTLTKLGYKKKGIMKKMQE